MVMTAGELIEILNNLPAAMEIKMGFVDAYGDEIEPISRHAISACLMSTGGDSPSYAICMTKPW